MKEQTIMIVVRKNGYSVRRYQGDVTRDIEKAVDLDEGLIEKTSFSYIDHLLQWLKDLLWKKKMD